MEDVLASDYLEFVNYYNYLIDGLTKQVCDRIAGINAQTQSKLDDLLEDTYRKINRTRVNTYIILMSIKIDEQKRKLNQLDKRDERQDKNTRRDKGED